MTTSDIKDKGKRLAHKVLNVPEERIPVVSTVDWIRNILDFNPVTAVRRSPHLFLTVQLSLPLTGDRLR